MPSIFRKLTLDRNIRTRGLPVLFPYVALPSIDVQALPKAVLATGEFEKQKDRCTGRFGK